MKNKRMADAKDATCVWVRTRQLEREPEVVEPDMERGREGREGGREGGRDGWMERWIEGWMDGEMEGGCTSKEEKGGRWALTKANASHIMRL